LRLLLWIVLAASTAASAFGWGGDGHRIVALIASGRLTPGARAMVAELIAEAGSGEATLPDIANWADRVRRMPGWHFSAPWHYVNLPRGENVTFDFARDCSDEGCIVSAIDRCREVLEGGATADFDEPMALMFLVHFVGDIHQPLHCGYGEDLGGNRIHVTFFGRRTNLHSVWDSGMLSRGEIPWRDRAARLEAELTSAEADEWDTTDPVVWVNESYQAAVVYAYDASPEASLGQDYLDMCLPVAEEQLLKAGVRLAAILNEIAAARAN
jgi:nuclease S1